MATPLTVNLKSDKLFSTPFVALFQNPAVNLALVFDDTSGLIGLLHWPSVPAGEC